MEPTPLSSPLPALLVAVPLVAAVLLPALGARWRRAGAGLTLAAVAASLVAAGVLVRTVLEHGVVAWEPPLIPGRFQFAVDPFGAAFALLAAFVWFCATLYSLPYLKGEGGESRFHGASLAALGAMLGVVTAGNLLTLFIFFEVLGLAALLLVIHAGSPAARRASVKYFSMVLVGGLALLGGILITYGVGGGQVLTSLPPEARELPLARVAFGLLLLGFGVKAGILPVHTWLPDAHGEAPTPASALLSGVMIKAGAYGILRTVGIFAGPVGPGLPGRPGPVGGAGSPGGGLDPMWSGSGEVGLVVLWIGLATMVVGITLALGQRHVKRALAYSSVSQMGLIVVGLGLAGYLGPQGALGQGGAVLQVINHGLFKAGLFLGIGAVVHRTGEVDLYRLGGLWRRMPLVFALTAVFAAGIVGVPLLNGFVGKSLIHHGLTQAHSVEGLASLGLAEKVFFLASAGTAALLIRILWLVFLRPRQGSRDQGRSQKAARTPGPMLAAMALLALPVVLIGVAPGAAVSGLLVPGAAAGGIFSEHLDGYLAEYFLSLPDLLTSGATIGVGVLIVLVGSRLRLFDLRLPPWVGVDHWYRWIARASFGAAREVGEAYERGVRRASVGRWAQRAGRLALWWSGDRGRGRVEPGDLVAAARRRIFLYARDVGFNVAVLFLVLLLLILAMAMGVGG